ncbi:MAG: alpha/beta hydrolase [Burkholderiales bacterium]|nr:MAG: alpha/beta hydrolase [Burkholderiales bacterium]
MSAIVSTVVTGATAYLAVVALLFMLQERMLFLPTRVDQATMRANAERAGMDPWLPDGQYRGLVTRGAGARGTIVVLQGNAGWAGDRAWYAEALAPLGFRVVLAEYPGYGARPGRPKVREIVGDTAETLRLVRAMMRGEPGSGSGPSAAAAPSATPTNASGSAPLIVLGESLGAGVVAQALRERPQLADGLLLITAWDSLANVGQSHYFWLPVRWLIKEPMDSVAALAGYPGRVLVVVAERDEIVPARFGTALARALEAPLEVVRGARHNDWPLHVDAGFWRRVIGPLLDDGN